MSIGSMADATRVPKTATMLSRSVASPCDDSTVVRAELPTCNIIRHSSTALPRVSHIAITPDYKYH